MFSDLADETLDARNRRPAPVCVADWAGLSSIGLRRAENQDNWGHGDDRLFAVADGIGSIPGGGLASHTAIAGLLQTDPAGAWVPAMRRLSEHVRDRCGEAGLEGAGTTLAALLLEPRRAVLIHIGDSRIYRLRGGHLRLLTDDHNLAALRHDWDGAGRATHPKGSPTDLASYLGDPGGPWRVDVVTASVEGGDRFLICTDGIHNQVSEHDLRHQLAIGRPQDAAAELIDSANAAGGRDNATGIVVDLMDAPS